MEAREQFDALYRREHAAMVRYAHALVGDPHLAEDIAQQVFQFAWANIDRGYLERESPALWLRAVGYHMARNRLRRIGVERRHLWRRINEARVDEPAGPIDPAVIAAFGLISQRDRHVVYLRAAEGWSFYEIGRTLDVSEAHARQINARSLRTLRSAMTDHSAAPELTRDRRR